MAKERIEDLVSSNDKLKKLNKRIKEREETLSTELEETKHELGEQCKRLNEIEPNFFYSDKYWVVLRVLINVS